MKCTDARPLLDLLCDGALDAKDSALLLDHIKTCDDCRHESLELDELRARFHEAKGTPTVPDGLMDRISAKLKEEEFATQKKSFKFSLPQISVIAIAAALLLIGLAFVPWLPKQAVSTAPAQVASNTLIDDVVSDATLEPVLDRNQLAKRLGYVIKYVRLPDWQMQRSGLYKSRAPVAIARFDFVRSNQSGLQTMTCYQAPQGVIRAAEAKAVNLDGKQVFFGHRGRFQFALWSQNGRDYLFVTTMPFAQLQDIVREA